jgi:hypothetical protein
MKLSELIKTEEIKIPETDLVITVKTELSWVEELEARKIEDPVEKGKYMLENIIIEWNIKDDDGKNLPVSAEALSKLPASIMFPISDRVQELVRSRHEKKKTSQNN